MKCIPMCFTALLERDGIRLGWTVARLPVHASVQWPAKQVRRVRGTLNGVEFESRLFKDARTQTQMVLVNNALRQAAGVRLGERVELSLEPDQQERPAAEMPAELSREFQGEKKIKRWFELLTPSVRREIGRWVEEPKLAQTRQKRAEKMAERLMLTMEGEVDAPAELKQIFARRPGAKPAWLGLTAIARRNHLLAIYTYVTPVSRMRRAEKAVDEAMERFKRKTEGGKQQ